MVTLTIDRITVTVPEGTTILEAASPCSIDIPTLCYLKDINEIARLPPVHGRGRGLRAPGPRLRQRHREGMVVSTNSPRVREARRVNLRLLLSQHDTKCTQVYPQRQLQAPAAQQRL